jgi:hypothetical protein
MTLWALRIAILGHGPWLLISNNENLQRLRNTPRVRELASHQLSIHSHPSMAGLF